MAIVSAKEVIGIGRQADIATVTTEFNAVPVDSGSFSASETYEQILDTGRRGTDALDFNAYQGVGSTEISFDFPMMWGAGAGANNTGSVLGILLRNILGSGAPTNTSDPSSVSSAEQRASCRTEKNGTDKTAFNTFFRLGDTKEYLSIARNLIGSNDHSYLGCRVSELTISSNAGEGAVTVSATLTGQTASVGASKTIYTDSTLSSDVALGYQNVFAGTTPYSPIVFGTVLYNSTLSNALNRIISFDLTLTRESTPLYTMSNSKTYNDLYLGPLAVTWNAVLEVDNTEMALIRAGTAIDTAGSKKTSIAFSKGTINDNSEKSLVIAMSASSPFESPMEIDTSGAYSTLAISGRALTTNAAMPISADDYDNASDTNRSPIEIQITESGHNTSTPPTYV